jgi:hypothetical protein
MGENVWSGVGLRTAVIAACAPIMIIVAGSACAHSWYEPACCSEGDCVPVDDGVVYEKVDGVHVQGWGVLSRTDPRVRWSRDDHDHVCAMLGKRSCVYRKPNGCEASIPTR